MEVLHTRDLIYADDAGKIISNLIEQQLEQCFAGRPSPSWNKVEYFRLSTLHNFDASTTWFHNLSPGSVKQ